MAYAAVFFGFHSTRWRKIARLMPQNLKNYKIISGLLICVIAGLKMMPETE